jgi:hypothetical protein
MIRREKEERRRRKKKKSFRIMVIDTLSFRPIHALNSKKSFTHTSQIIIFKNFWSPRFCLFSIYNMSYGYEFSGGGGFGGGGFGNMDNFGYGGFGEMGGGFLGAEEKKSSEKKVCNFLIFNLKIPSFYFFEFD